MPSLSLNASKKTKHTPAGEIPVDWGWAELARFATIKHGFAFEGPSMSAKATTGPIVVAIGNFKYTGGFRFDTTKRQRFVGQETPRDYILKPGALLVAMTCQTPGGEILGIPGQIPDDGETYLHNQRLGLVEVAEERPLSKHYLYHVFCWEPFNRFLFERATGTKVKHTSPSTILSYPAALPPLPEQRRIAAILSTWDRAIETLESLIAAKDRRKKALMQQLLTGRKRLPGFDQSSGLTKRDRFERYPADWEALRLGQITTETGKRNSRGGDHPVLSCTKHHGLVLSEEYFGRRVHAEDTSNYRLVHRGEFAYATNHIEEGSIGYQDLCETGLVSPIYTAFKSNGRVSPNYLFRVLKSPLFLHLYQVNTSASVDRRGSLRYKEFSQLPVWLPSRSEQDAITSVFDTIDRELALHRQHLATLRTQKRGLMQKLLTGQVRVSP